MWKILNIINLFGLQIKDNKLDDIVINKVNLEKSKIEIIKIVDKRIWNKKINNKFYIKWTENRRGLRKIINMVIKGYSNGEIIITN